MRRTLFLGYLAVLVCGTAHANFAIHSTVHNGNRYVYIQDVGAYYGLRIWRQADDITLFSKTQRVDFVLNNRFVKVNGTRLHLSYAPLTLQGYPCISERDFTQLLDPILRDWGLGKHQLKRIVIDPGHGGSDEGARGVRYREKDLTLRMALLLKAILEQAGYEVLLTRTADTDLSLTQRPEICRKWKGDLFISIHCNAAADKSVQGIETFILPPRGTPSTSKGTSSSSSYIGNATDRNNARLAFEIQRHLIATTKEEDRGVRRERFAVLRDAPCPAVLLELGFLSNALSEKKLAASNYQQSLMLATAQAIVAYHRAMLSVPSP